MWEAGYKMHLFYIMNGIEISSSFKPLLLQGQMGAEENYIDCKDKEENYIGLPCLCRSIIISFLKTKSTHIALLAFSNSCRQETITGKTDPIFVIDGIKLAFL